jgi:2-hydroxy-6-oxonona-2,4-dienedioate hydrolase
MGSHCKALPEGKWLDVNGIRTRYYDEGSGETVVFIYGGNFGSSDSASSAYTWSENFRPLSQRFRVVAFDKLGQGLTDNPANDDYTMRAVVRHARDFIRALRLGPVHLVGHSRGGYAAVRVALEDHDLVKTLTIINSSTLAPGVGTNEVVLARPPHPPGTRECARWVYENYCYSPSAVTEEWVDAVMQTLALPKYREAIAKMNEEGLATRLFLPELAREKRETLQWIGEGRVQRPTQLVWGFNDRTAVIERGVELFQMMAAHERQTQLHIINQSGHFPFREHPGRFNSLLAEFVAAQS